VAHEINNPLTYVKSNLSYVREELSRLGAAPGSQGPLDEALADAGEGVERVRGIVRRLMALSRVETAAGLHAVDLHAALDACLETVRREVHARGRLRREYGDIPPVLGDRTRIVQVFVNLLFNAVQALPEGSPDRHEVWVATRLDPESGQVMVEVSDTGCGIPERSLERIWDPFFSTKPVDQGVGLGLSICRSLVGALGGRIAARSREGAGSTFTVWLRSAAAHPPHGAEESGSAVLEGRR
jgi:signal transduction histidine kinase